MPNMEGVAFHVDKYMKTVNVNVEISLCDVLQILVVSNGQAIAG